MLRSAVELYSYTLTSILSHETCFAQQSLSGSDMRYLWNLFFLCQKIDRVSDRVNCAILSHIMKTWRRTRSILNAIWGHLWLQHTLVWWADVRIALQDLYLLESIRLCNPSPWEFKDLFPVIECSKCDKISFLRLGYKRTTASTVATFSCPLVLPLSLFLTHTSAAATSWQHPGSLCRDPYGKDLRPASSYISELGSRSKSGA